MPSSDFSGFHRLPSSSLDSSRFESSLPLPWHADEWLLVAPLAKAEELVHRSLGLEEELLHAVLQLLVAALEIRIHCPQMHHSRCVQEIIHRQPLHK